MQGLDTGREAGIRSARSSHGENYATVMRSRMTNLVEIEVVNESLALKEFKGTMS